MKLLLIYRNINRGFSIERVFKPIEEELSKKIEVSSIHLPSMKSSIIEFFKDGLIVLKYLIKNKCDIVHITGDSYYLLLLLYPLFKVKRIKTIATVHDMGFFVNNKPGLYRLYLYLLWAFPLKLANLITCISKKTQDEVHEILHIDNEKNFIVYNAVAPCFSFIENDPLLKTKKILLQIGTAPNKNLERIIKAIVGSDYYLRIIGRLTDEQRDLLAKGKVHYSCVSNLSDEDILEEYRKCDIVVFVSLYEGYGMPIIEGQAIGRPVLTSNISPMKEVAGDGACLVDPNNIQEIKNGISYLFDNYKVIQEKGFENVGKYRVENIANDYLQCYNSILNIL